MKKCPAKFSLLLLLLLLLFHQCCWLTRVDRTSSMCQEWIHHQCWYTNIVVILYLNAKNITCRSWTRSAQFYKINCNKAAAAAARLMLLLLLLLFHACIKHCCRLFVDRNRTWTHIMCKCSGRSGSTSDIHPIIIVKPQHAKVYRKKQVNNKFLNAAAAPVVVVNLILLIPIGCPEEW